MPSISRPRSPPLPNASGASVRVPAETLMPDSSPPHLSSGRTAQAGRRWSDLRPRIASACILGATGLAGLFIGGAAWNVLLAACLAGLSIEWAMLCTLPALRGATLVASLLACLALAALGYPIQALAALLPAWLLVWLATRGSGGRPLAGAAGVIYLGLPAIALVWLRNESPAGLGNVLFVLMVVWASDIGAYLAGRLIGGPRLAPRISPGKTWSGAIGGLLAALVAGIATGAWLGATPLAAGAVAVPLALVSQAGDLLESAIKRWVGVKDSSRLIPGHGGLLDRLDGVLAAAPLAALIVLCLGQGEYLWR
jgi:phosphatidate cytidylyltransferase